jgi:hypothetical protein
MGCMVICICRNIRESDYADRADLEQRVLQGDHCCGKCLEDFEISGITKCNDNVLTKNNSNE